MEMANPNDGDLDFFPPSIFYLPTALLVAKGLQMAELIFWSGPLLRGKSNRFEALGPVTALSPRMSLSGFIPSRISVTSERKHKGNLCKAGPASPEGRALLHTPLAAPA